MRTPFGDLPDHWSRASLSEQHDHLQAGLGRRAVLSRRALVTGAALAVASPALWVQPARAVGPLASRHVGFGTDPRHEAVVSFAVDRPFRKAAVEYGVDGSFGSRVEVDARTVRGVSTVYGHARLDGLAAGTAYRYRVRLDGVTTGARTLTTAPAQPGPFTFTAFGDQGVSRQAQAVVTQLARVKPRFHLLAGDLCYADSSGRGQIGDVFDPTIWDRWLAMIDPVAAQTAWMCVAGNHDMEPGYGPQGYDGYLARFRLPANGAPGCPATYAFRYGNVGVISLDANDVSYEIPHNLGYSGGAQTAWLERQLTALRAEAGIDFVVVLFHHCAFSTSNAHGSEGGIREHWVPLFDRHQVDLVINGHAHVYERTSQLRGGNVVGVAARSSRVDSRTGTTYITAGGGGQVTSGVFTGHDTVSLSGGAHQREAAPWSLPTRTTVHSFLAVDVTPSSANGPAAMAIRVLDKDGRQLDDVTLVRGQPGSSGSDHAVPWVAGGAVTATAGLAAAGVAGRLAWRARHPNAPAPPPQTLP